jgi:hypothetical protein
MKCAFSEGGLSRRTVGCILNCRLVNRFFNFLVLRSAERDAVDGVALRREAERGGRPRRLRHIVTGRHGVAAERLHC